MGMKAAEVGRIREDNRGLQNESARRAQSSQSDLDEPAHSDLGRQAAGSCEGIEAVARELVSRGIFADFAGLCALGEQISDHVVNLPLGPGDVRTSMQKRRESSVMVHAVLVRYERISLEHCLQPRWWQTRKVVLTRSNDIAPAIVAGTARRFEHGAAGCELVERCLPRKRSFIGGRRVVRPSCCATMRSCHIAACGKRRHRVAVFFCPRPADALHHHV